MARSGGDAGGVLAARCSATAGDGRDRREGSVMGEKTSRVKLHVATATVRPLAETHSITEVRGEASDPDRGVAFAETHTVTKVKNEADDSDARGFAGAVDWMRGDRRPLLFRDAVAMRSEASVIGYDDSLDMAVDDEGRPLIFAASTETGTSTSVTNETFDQDR